MFIFYVKSSIGCVFIRDEMTDEGEKEFRVDRSFIKNFSVGGVETLKDMYGQRR